MRAKEMLVLAAGATLLAGGAALANDPVPTSDGRTLTPAIAGTVEQTLYPQGCPAIYETFDTTYEPNYGVGWTISDWPQIGCWGPAHKFTSAGDYALCQVLVSATHVTGVNQYRVRLHADDAGGSEPGTALGTWDFTGIPQNQAGPTPLLECDATGISLDNGASYWLSIIASGGASNSWGVLRQSTLPGNERPNATWKCTNWEFRGTLNAGAWRVTGEQGGAGPRISVSGDCPGRVTVAWSNATANKSMAIASASSAGSYVVPGGPCAGTTLGLSSSGLQVNYQGNTGSGAGQVSSSVGTGACGRYVQMIVVGSPCETSNVVQVP